MSAYISVDRINDLPPIHLGPANRPSHSELDVFYVGAKGMASFFLNATWSGSASAGFELGYIAARLRTVNGHWSGGCRYDANLLKNMHWPIGQ